MLPDWKGQSETFIKEKFAPEFDISVDRVGRYIHKLKENGWMSEALQVNPYRTHFNHQFQVRIRLDLFQLAKASEKARAPNQSVQAGEDAQPSERPDPCQWFIDKLMQNIKDDKELSKSLIVFDGIVILGAWDSDLELTLFSSDGIKSVYRWITDELKKYAFITGVNTATVSYSHRWRGYAGQQLREFPDIP